MAKNTSPATLDEYLAARQEVVTRTNKLTQTRKDYTAIGKRIGRLEGDVKDAEDAVLEVRGRLPADLQKQLSTSAAAGNVTTK